MTWRQYRFRPYIHLWLDLGFLQARTAIMHEALESMSTEYIVLELIIFGKGFKFRLYDTRRTKCD